MRSVAAGSFARLSSLPGLWRAYGRCRRGKRRRLDHHVKRVLKVPAYLRYMDDFTLFSDDAAQLERARGAIAAWLDEQRGLELGRKRWEVIDTAQPATFVGYRIARAGLWPGPKIRKRMGSRLRAAADRGRQSLLRSIRSYRGIFLF